MESVSTGLLEETELVSTHALAMSTDVARFHALSNEDLQTLARRNADVARLVEIRGNLLAAEIAQRSAPELGSAGLAQKLGHRTPAKMIERTTGVSGYTAKNAIDAGQTLNDAAGLPDPVTGAIEPPKEPWMHPVAAAITAGRLSGEQLSVIRKGLGAPTATVTAQMLTEAAKLLVDEAAFLTLHQLARRAAAVRDEIDPAGISEREARRRAKRRLIYVAANAEAISKLIWEMDPETDAPVKALYDRLTSPKRGGPRFVDEAEQAKADAIANDDRTPEQLASDGFLHLLEAGADADDSQLLGSGGPIVKYTVVKDEFDNGTGIGRIEGAEATPVSQETLERLVCGGATEEIIFDKDLNPIDVGKLMRLYSKKQKTALAARDGGCMWPGCDRPPSWTEAHHVEHHHKGGKTTIENGILLCRFHHLLLHNNLWSITRDLFGWWLIPPVDVDPNQVPRPMPTKSLAYKDLERHRDRRQESSAQAARAEEARRTEQAALAEDATRVAQASHVEQGAHVEQAAQAEQASRVSQVSHAEQAARAEDARQEELAELAMLTLLAALERTPIQYTG